MPPTTLFISGFLPSAYVPSGGQQLVHRVLQETAARKPTILLAFQNEHEAAIDVGTDFACCVDAHIVKLTRSRRFRAALRHPLLPLIASARFAAAQRWVRDRMAEGQVQDVWCEFIQAASLLGVIPRGVPTTLVVHDLFHEALERRAALAHGARRFLWHLEARRTRSWERRILARPDRLLTLTERDRATIQRLCGRRDVEVRYPEPSAFVRSIRRSRETIERGTVLFFGQMSRQENEDAAIWFIEAIWPDVRRAHPSARLIVAGADPTPAVRARAREDIVCTGYVERPEDLLAKAQLSIAPLRLGAGIKIKVVDALAAGIPTVATSIGAEGVRPSELLTIADDATGFGRACVRLLG
jgi:glycosyltransferase involved in cell wall biosynthesis